MEPLILRGHTWPVRALAVTPDGNTLFSGGSGNDTETFIHRWTLAGSSVVTADTLAEEIHDLDVLQVSPGGRWLLSHGRYLDHARLHDLSTPGVGAYKIGFYPDFDVPPPFNGGVFSPDERWLILRTIPKDRPDGLFKLSGVSPKLVLGGNWRTHDKTDLLRATAFDATSHWMLARDKKDGLLLWDVSGEEPVPSVSDGRAIAAVSSDGRWFALGQKDGCVEVFSLKDPTTVATCVPTEYGPVDGIEVDADKSWLAIGRKTEKEGPFRWTLRKFSPSVGTDYDLGVLINLRFISEGVLVGWGEQAVIDLWKLGTDGVWQKFALRGHAAAIQHLAWTPDGRCLISGSDDTTLRLWDTEKPNQDPVVLRGHRGKISAMTLTPDGRRLISGDTLGEIRVWRLWTPDARPVERLTPLIQLSRDVVGRNLTGEERHGYQIGD